jgi:diguanylate cyclase (GGDEF)-like protein/PAS domain S-box-containing protein
VQNRVAEGLGQRRILTTFWLGLVVAAAAICLALISALHLTTEIPPAWVLVSYAIVNLGITYLAQRRLPWAPLAMCYVNAFFIPGIIVIPAVTNGVDPSYFVPAILALALGTSRTLLACTVAPVLVLIARAPNGLASTYADPSFLVIHAVLVLGLYSAQRLLLNSLDQAARSRLYEVAATRAASDIVLWSGNSRAQTNGRYWSDAVRNVLGYDPRELSRLGTRPLDLVHKDDRAMVRDRMIEVTTGVVRSEQFECRVQRKDGVWIWMAARAFDLCDNPDIGGIVTTLRDITEERSVREAHATTLRHLADHDALTDLPNRRRLNRDLDLLIAGKHANESVADPEVVVPIQGSLTPTSTTSAPPSPFVPSDAPPSGVSLSPFASGMPSSGSLAAAVVSDDDPLGQWLLFCDFDSFKHINDSLGHDVGDDLLIAISQRLKKISDGTVYRIGGDEFVVLLPNSNGQGAKTIARSIVQSAAAPYSIRGHRLVVTLSIGVASAMRGMDREALLRNADMAMYAAKEGGKNGFRLFDAKMDRAALRRHRIEQGLRSAIAENQLYVVYQPRIESKSGRCLGFEALLRWKSSELGEISPGEFIPIAEDTGLIAELGTFVLREACREFGQWHAEGMRVSVSVNVSVGQFNENVHLVEQVDDALREYAFPAESLELEITESVFTKEPDRVVESLHALTKLGTRIAVDDFGTGYSSLAYLRRFPVNVLKVDRSFIIDLESKEESRAIVGAILALADKLHIRTIAEGVETESQRRTLAEMGCHELQGFLIAKPMRAADARAFVTSSLRITGS